MKGNTRFNRGRGPAPAFRTLPWAESRPCRCSEAPRRFSREEEESWNDAPLFPDVYGNDASPPALRAFSNGFPVMRQVEPLRTPARPTYVLRMINGGKQQRRRRCRTANKSRAAARTTSARSRQRGGFVRSSERNVIADKGCTAGQRQVYDAQGQLACASPVQQGGQTFQWPTRVTNVPKPGYAASGGGAGAARSRRRRRRC